MTGLEAFIVPALASAQSAASAAAPYLAVAGTGLTVASTVQQSNQASAAAKIQAQQAEQKANAETVAGQVKSQQELNKKEQLLSLQRARFGASGGGTQGTAAQVMADTEGQGDYNAEMQLWQGQERARGYMDDAKFKLYTAAQERAALPLKIGSQIVTGASKMYAGMPSFGEGPVIDASYDPESGFSTVVTKNSGYRYGY